MDSGLCMFEGSPLGHKGSAAQMSRACSRQNHRSQLCCNSAAGADFSGSSGSLRAGGYPPHRPLRRYCRDCEVLAHALAGIPLLDVDLHGGAPHRPPHPLQARQRVERRKGAALGHRSLRLPPPVRLSCPALLSISLSLLCFRQMRCPCTHTLTLSGRKDRLILSSAAPSDGKGSGNSPER